jgi:hypothetical protein
MGTRDRRAGLVEAVEDARQELAIDSDPRIADLEFDIRPGVCQQNIHRAAARREFHRIGQQVQPTCCKRLGVIGAHRPLVEPADIVQNRDVEGISRRHAFFAADDATLAS